jgi:hypothetical protein
LAACQAHGKIISQKSGHCRHRHLEFTNWVEEPLSVTGSIKELPKNILPMCTGQIKQIQSKHFATVCEAQKRILRDLNVLFYDLKRDKYVNRAWNMNVPQASVEQSEEEIFGGIVFTFWQCPHMYDFAVNTAFQRKWKRKESKYNSLTT